MSNENSKLEKNDFQDSDGSYDTERLQSFLRKQARTLKKIDYSKRINTAGLDDIVRMGRTLSGTVNVDVAKSISKGVQGTENLDVIARMGKTLSRTVNVDVAKSVSKGVQGTENLDAIARMGRTLSGTVNVDVAKNMSKGIPNTMIFDPLRDISVITQSKTDMSSFSKRSSILSSTKTMIKLRKFIPDTVLMQNLDKSLLTTRSLSGFSKLDELQKLRRESLFKTQGFSNSYSKVTGIFQDDNKLHDLSRQLAGVSLAKKYKPSTIASWTKIINSSYLNNPRFYTSLKPLITKYEDDGVEGGVAVVSGIEIAATKDLIVSEGQIQLDLSDDELWDFRSSLSKSPMLGLMHKTGRKIYDYFSKLKVVKQRIGVPLYHGRSRNSEDAPFVESELNSEAPWGIPNPGRFNVANQGLYYTSDSLSSLSKELRLKDGEVYDAIKFQPDVELGILDLTKENKSLLSFCLQKVSGEYKRQPVEYLIPTFIAQCLLKNRNVQVIKINSAADDSATNYIFLSPSMRDYVDEDEIEILRSRHNG